MTHDANSSFRRLLRDERGVAAVLVAAAIVAVVGVGALVVDVAYFFYAQAWSRRRPMPRHWPGRRKSAPAGRRLPPRRHTAA